MQIFTVTYDGRPAAVVRAADRVDAVAVARDLIDALSLPDMPDDHLFEAREPDDAEMVGWLSRREDHLAFEPTAQTGRGW